MKKKTRRYLFAFYDDINGLGFHQYNLICDRMFLFVPEEVQNLPMDMVVNLQKLGAGLKWIRTSASSFQENALMMAFLMGRLHEKMPSDIEFAILYDEQDFDALIEFLRSKGRSCLRVLSNTIEIEEKEDHIPLDKPVVAVATPTAATVVAHRAIPNATAPDSIGASVSYIRKEAPTESKISVPLPVDESLSLRDSASKITEWLKRSGNRPADIGLLRQYITLNNPEMKPNGADNVIFFMATHNDIEIRDKEVVYNF